ncbi:MAG: flagellar export chaperone FliS [Gemmatimonadaceae bacterium]|nr:flagellar export chaperone FliS [Gemmatimonadaceae bacterium]
MPRPSVQQYREAEILTASPGRLLVITYDALLAAMTRARVGIAMKDEQVTSSGLDRARGLLGELLATLDHSVGGDLSKQLSALYVFLLTEMGSVALRGDVNMLDRHIHIVRELRDAWVQIQDTPQRLAS